MEGLNDNLIKLRIIASLGPQERLRIHRDGSVSLDKSHNILNSLVRWWCGDSRQRTIQYVRSTLSDAVRHVCQMSEQGRSEDIALLCQELRASLDGVENLKKTYIDDVQIVSLLDVIQKQVEYHLKKVESTSIT